MTVVDNSAFAARQNQSFRESKRPDYAGESKEACIIKKVYDADTIAAEGDDEIKRHSSYVVGANYTLCEVELVSAPGIRYLLPFGTSRSELAGTYGNALLLEGAPAEVRYHTAGVETGKVFLVADATQPELESRELISVASIGDIF
jgi:hypothetical protein